MLHLGNVPANSTLYVPFQTFNNAGASVTLTGLAVTDIEIYKNGSVTQRASDNGYALLDTDGIDFDGITGIHGFSIDLADNTTAGFYSVGDFFWVVVSAVTVDAQTVNFIAATFRIVAAEVAAGKPKVEVDAFNDTGVNDRLSRIGFDVDTGLRTHISDVDTGLHDTLADYDTGVRALLALRDTGAIATAVWAGDTGLRDHISNVDTGITNRLGIIAADVDTGLRRQINCLDTGIHGVLADYDTGIRGILITSGVSIDTGVVNQAVWQANGARGITAVSDTGLNAHMFVIEGQTNKLTFDTGNKIHAAIYKVKGIGIIGSGDTGSGDPFRPLT